MKVGVNKNDVIIDTRRDELLSEQGAELIHSLDRDYFEILKKKLHWGHV